MPPPRRMRVMSFDPQGKPHPSRVEQTAGELDRLTRRYLNRRRHSPVIDPQHDRFPAIVNLSSTLRAARRQRLQRRCDAAQQRELTRLNLTATRHPIQRIVTKLY